MGYGHKQVLQSVYLLICIGNFSSMPAFQQVYSRVRTGQQELNSRTFKAMCQQIQGLNTEEGVRNQQNLTLHCSKRNFIMRSDMNMQNQFNKMSVLNVKQFQKISKN